MRERFTRAWWQIFVGSMVVGAVVGLGIGVIVGAGIGGAQGSPTGPAGGREHGRTPGTVSKRTTPTTVSREREARRAGGRLGGYGANHCAGYCVSLYSLQLGSGATLSVIGVAGTRARVQARSLLGLVAHGLDHLAGQFTISLLARVGQFCGVNKHDFFPPGGYLCRHEHAFRVLEVAWSPHGNQSGLCVGVAVAGHGGQSVALRPCGADSRTLWIADQFHPAGTVTSTRAPCVVPGEFCPLVNGADFSLTKPLVLTVYSTSRSPANRLRIEPLALVPGKARGRAAIPLQEFSFTSRTP